MAGEDSDYLASVRGLPCLVRTEHMCDGPTEAHHAGSKGMSQRAHDYTAVPLCRLGHMQWHSASGPFRHLDKEGRRAWAEKAIETTVATLGAPF